MKLLIDIDDKEKAICEQYINGKLGDELGDYINITELAEAIRNGIPYETKGDLISREALKEAFEDLFYNDYDDQVRTERLIDNAPTVEPFEPDYVGAERLAARQRGYEQGYHYGMEIGKTLNPQIKQGEWEHWGSPFSDEQVVNSIVCSVCGARFVEIQDEVFNFCPNCGAKMQKGGKEE